MKNVFLIIVHFVLISTSIGQNDLRNANWAMSNQAGLNFNFTSPQPFSSSIGIENTSSASVSDTDGNLLFYTNGLTVWNSDNSVMTGGTGLIGGFGDVSQNIVIVPNPNDSNKYYIFSISGGQIIAGLPRHGLRYSEVTMSNGFGSVSSPNTPLEDEFGTLIDDNYVNNYGKITTASHSNGIDYWLIAEIGTRVFSYLIDDEGVNFALASNSPILTLPGTTYMEGLSEEICSGNGPMKISPDNSRILIGYAGTYDIANNFDGGRLMVGLFNDGTGAVTDFIDIQRDVSIGARILTGAEFSPNGNTIHQLYEGFIISNTIILNIANLLEITDTSILETSIDVRNLQRAIDGRIYFESFDITQPTPFFISFIGNPNAEPFDVQFNVLNANSASFIGSIPTWVQNQNCLRTLTTSSLISNSLNLDRENWIVSSNIINSLVSGTPTRVIYHAGEYIELNPGFETQNGSEFVAYIEGCSGNFAYRPSNPDANPSQALEKTSVLSASSKLQIYPNPSNTFVNIALEANKLKSIVITSLDGKVILNQNVNSNSEQIDVSSYSKGMYLITVQTDEGKTINKKFIKN